MKKLSNLVKTLFTVAVMALLVGCGYSDEDKALMDSYVENGKVNAVDYIEDKYGFTPEIKSVKVLKVDPGPVPNFFPAATGYVDVTMKYQGKEFLVNINGEEYTTKGKDNYQKEEIETALKSWLETDMAISIEAIDAQYKNECMLEEKFTDVGSFLDEAKGNDTVSVVVKTLDDISEKTVEKIDADALALLVVSCRDMDGLEALSNFKYLNDQSYKLNFYREDYMSNKLSEYSIFMKGHVFKSVEGNVTCRLFEHKEIEDGMYVVFDKSEDASGLKITETNAMAPADDWRKDVGKVTKYPTLENPKKISESYAVDFGNLSKIQVFISQNSLSKNDNSEKYIALQYMDEDGYEVYDHMATAKVEDYYSFTLDRQSDMKIAVMINSK